MTKQIFIFSRNFIQTNRKGTHIQQTIQSSQQLLQWSIIQETCPCSTRSQHFMVLLFFCLASRHYFCEISPFIHVIMWPFGSVLSHQSTVKMKSSVHSTTAETQIREMNVLCYKKNRLSRIVASTLSFLVGLLSIVLSFSSKLLSFFLK